MSALYKEKSHRAYTCLKRQVSPSSLLACWQCSGTGVRSPGACVSAERPGAGAPGACSANSLPGQGLVPGTAALVLQTPRCLFSRVHLGIQDHISAGIRYLQCQCGREELTCSPRVTSVPHNMHMQKNLSRIFLDYARYVREGCCRASHCCQTGQHDTLFLQMQTTLLAPQLTHADPETVTFGNSRMEGAPVALLAAVPLQVRREGTPLETPQAEMGPRRLCDGDAARLLAQDRRTGLLIRRRCRGQEQRTSATRRVIGSGTLIPHFEECVGKRIGSQMQENGAASHVCVCKRVLKQNNPARLWSRLVLPPWQLHTTVLCALLAM
jgi:hypothetical protein